MKLVKTTGEVREFVIGGKKATLEELQSAVGGLIEIVYLRPQMMLIVNEEGKLKNLPINMPATVLYQDLCHTTDVIVGDCLLAQAKELD